MRSIPGEFIAIITKLESQLAEALANEQSSATAYAEAQALNEKMLGELKAARYAIDLLAIQNEGSVVSFQAEKALSRLDAFLKEIGE